MNNPDISRTADPLFQPLILPCGTTLKNRFIKSAMSDSLGDGTGHPTQEQTNLYRHWADGGIAASIIGEVQFTSGFAEKPGNLVLNNASDPVRFTDLAAAGGSNGSLLWMQLGHAGALAYAPTSQPAGPSELKLPGLACRQLTMEEIVALPAQFAATAALARKYGFGGVQIHAAHGFLLSQFLSPLFNKRTDIFGGKIENRAQIILEVIAATRNAVGPDFPIAIKLNSSDQLEGGLKSDDALKVVEMLDASSVDLIDISGGTYFPGAKSASDGAGRGPYFLEFAKQARSRTQKPLMLTGGFKTFEQANAAVTDGYVDVVGLARAMVIEPSLPQLWASWKALKPEFPRFAEAPEGGVTAWYTMRLTALAEGREMPEIDDLHQALALYDARDRERTKTWLRHFNKQ